MVSDLQDFFFFWGGVGRESSEDVGYLSSHFGASGKLPSRSQLPIARFAPWETCLVAIATSRAWWQAPSAASFGKRFAFGWAV